MKETRDISYYENLAEDDDLASYLDKECTKIIDIYQLGWELDYKAWLMSNGDIIHTSWEFDYYIFDKEKWDEYKNRMISYVESLKNIDVND